MAEGKQGTMVLNQPQIPILRLQAKLKEFEGGVKLWLSKQSVAMEAAAVTAAAAAQGAAMGGIMGAFTKDAASSFPAAPQSFSSGAVLNPEAMASLNQAQALAGGPLIQARNFAVMTGVNAGIACVMKRIRGKEDIQSSMVAGFGSGAMFSLVSGMGTPNQAANVITTGIFFALAQGGLFKFGEKFKQSPVEDVRYTKTRSLLAILGLQNYEKNFKNGLLTDTTLPLLNDSALRDAKIPPGPRLLILDHIQRDPELQKKRRG